MDTKLRPVMKLATKHFTSAMLVVLLTLLATAYASQIPRICPLCVAPSANIYLKIVKVNLEPWLFAPLNNTHALIYSANTLALIDLRTGLIKAKTIIQPSSFTMLKALSERLYLLISPSQLQFYILDGKCIRLLRSVAIDNAVYAVMVDNTTIVLTKDGDVLSINPWTGKVHRFAYLGPIEHVVRLKTIDNRLLPALVIQCSDSVWLLDLKELNARVLFSEKVNIYDAVFDEATGEMLILADINGLTLVRLNRLLRYQTFTRISDRAFNAVILSTNAHPLIAFASDSSLIGVRAGSEGIEWSIPLGKGEVLKLYRLFIGGKPYLLYVFNGRVNIVDVKKGKPLWGYIWGLPLPSDCRLVEQEFTPGISRLFLVCHYAIAYMDLPKLLQELEVVDIGLLFKGNPVEYNATITCVKGSCITVIPEPITYHGRGITYIALPYGVYNIQYTSIIGVYTVQFELAKSSCIPGGEVTIIDVNPANLTICVVSEGDPQGWGLLKGPVQGAIVTIKSSTGFSKSLRTDSSGCVMFRDIPPVEYQVFILSNLFENTSVTVKLSQGESKTVIVKIKPLLATVYIKPIARDTGAEITDAVVALNYQNKTIVLRKLITPVYLPLGRYVVTVNAPYYIPTSANITISKPTVYNIPIYMEPRLYNITVVGKLAIPAVTTVSIKVYRVEIGGEKLTYINTTKTTGATFSFKFALPWGVYHIVCKAPYHNDYTVYIRVPQVTVVNVELSASQYTLLVKAYDAFTRLPIYNATVEVIGSRGLRMKTQAFKPLKLPIDNYTILVSARHYDTRKIVVELNRDRVVTAILSPTLYRVVVKATIGNEKVRKAVLQVVGKTFNGIGIRREVLLINGSAELRIPAGSYTAILQLSVKPSGLLYTLLPGSVEIRSSKSFIVESDTEIKMNITPPITLMVLNIVPYLMLTAVIVIIIVVILALRRKIKEHIRRLKEALVERFGGRAGAEELFAEETEELF